MKPKPLASLLSSGPLALSLTLVILGSAACGGDDPADSGPDAAPATVSYAADIAPIFLARCIACHNNDSAIGYDLRMDPFDPQTGMFEQINSWTADHDSPLESIVVPGSPDESFLMFKLATDPAQIDPDNNGDAMPFEMPRVTAEELADIKTWITDGANDDAFFQDRVAPIFGTDKTLGRRRGKCTFCHYPGNSTGLDVLAVFDTETGLVGADSLVSDKPRVDPGNPDNSFLVEKIEQESPSVGQQMPLRYPRLSAEELTLVRTWIAEGARNN
ncbi:MAG: hypothetical protein Tsb0020_34340 [Haliangiales bacterium]